MAVQLVDTQISCFPESTIIPSQIRIKEGKIPGCCYLGIRIWSLLNVKKPGLGFLTGRWSLYNEGLIESQGEFCTFLHCITSHALRQILQVSEHGFMVTGGRVEGCLCLGRAHVYLTGMI